MHVPGKISTLVGVGSSILRRLRNRCNSPVIDTMMKRLREQFPLLFSSSTCWLPLFFPASARSDFHLSGEAFGIFARTAVNDTSSVTAAASTWDSLYQLGTQTLDKAVTVKLTRTLAIIPITLVLALVRTKSRFRGQKVEFKKDFSRCLFSLLCAGFRHHNNRNFSRCFRIRIFSSQNTEQVLHRPRHVRGRFKYKHCKNSSKPAVNRSPWAFAAGSASRA